METKSDVHCDICLQFVLSTPLYGEMIRKEGIDVHYYCLLSASELPQNGNDNKGIYGFIVDDIKRNIPKFEENICIFCREKGAAVKCAYKGCDKTWHYPCGKLNCCITEFIGQFNSYCHSHVPHKNVMSHKGAMCRICYKYMLTNHPAVSIFSPCCKELPKLQPNLTDCDVQAQCFSHADCIQRYVIAAGYDSKCPNCNMESMTKKEWQDNMRFRGIFVPQRMAEWEDDEYFKSQTKNKCSNEKCPKPHNRYVFTCFICGCFPLHLSCAKVRSHEEYTCLKCINNTFVNLF